MGVGIWLHQDEGCHHLGSDCTWTCWAEPKAEPKANPLTVKAKVGVNVNSGSSQSENDQVKACPTCVPVNPGPGDLKGCKRRGPNDQCTIDGTVDCKNTVTGMCLYTLCCDSTYCDDPDPSDPEKLGECYPPKFNAK